LDLETKTNKEKIYGFFNEGNKGTARSGSGHGEKKRGGFLITSKTFHPLIGGKELEEEYATVSIESLETDKRQVNQDIHNLQKNKKSFQAQIDQIDKQIEERNAALPEFDYFIEHLKNLGTTRKEKK
jgi:hypothetical protein